MAAITLERVSRRFGATTVVDGLDLHVEEGSFVTLLGPSGCGKTTTLRMVAGLEQNDGGRISIGERCVGDAAKQQFVPPEKRGIGMVFQSYAIWPHMTVAENVAYPLRVRGASAETVVHQVQEALALVEMAHLKDRPSAALSGGQQQRVAIARALVGHPKVLLLDEPLSNLDARLRVQTGEEFRALQQRLGVTALYVTHDQEEALALSDKIVVMHGGRAAQEGSPREVYERPLRRSVAAFFGNPNLVKAEVRDCRPLPDGDCELQLAAPGWTSTARSAQAYAAGTAVRMMIRPESLRAGDAGPDSQSWNCRVVGHIYRGAKVTTHLETAEGNRLLADLPGRLQPRTGDTISLHSERRDHWVVADDLS